MTERDNIIKVIKQDDYKMYIKHIKQACKTHNCDYKELEYEDEIHVIKLLITKKTQSGDIMKATETILLF